LFLSLFQ